jgi:hypothetical protein
METHLRIRVAILAVFLVAVSAAILQVALAR